MSEIDCVKGLLQDRVREGQLTASRMSDAVRKELVLLQDTWHVGDVVVAQPDGWKAFPLEPALLTLMTPRPHLADKDV